MRHQKIPDIALLDYWVGGAALLVAPMYYLFEQYAIGVIINIFGFVLLFGLEPAQYLIETLDGDEFVDARLYRPNPFKPFIFKDDLVSGPYTGLELELLKLDLEVATQ